MKFVIYLLLICTMISCSNRDNSSQLPQALATDVFDSAGSDPAAIELADSVFQALGGAENWNNVKAISWASAGRKFYWDPVNRLGRLESGDTTALFNSNTGEAQVSVAGEANAQVTSRQALWDKEFYDLLIPYEIKRSGATLTYMGEDSLAKQRYNSLVLTFKNRPDKYKLYVDKQTKMIRYGAYYSLATNVKEDALSSWDNYQQVGAIKFSFNRSSGGPTDVLIEENLPVNFFTTF